MRTVPGDEVSAFAVAARVAGRTFASRSPRPLATFQDACVVSAPEAHLDAVRDGVSPARVIGTTTATTDVRVVGFRSTVE